MAGQLNSTTLNYYKVINSVRLRGDVGRWVGMGWLGDGIEEGTF